MTARTTRTTRQTVSETSGNEEMASVHTGPTSTLEIHAGRRVLDDRSSLIYPCKMLGGNILHVAYGNETEVPELWAQVLLYTGLRAHAAANPQHGAQDALASLPRGFLFKRLSPDGIALAEELWRGAFEHQKAPCSSYSNIKEISLALQSEITQGHVVLHTAPESGIDACWEHIPIGGERAGEGLARSRPRSSSSSRAVGTAPTLQAAAASNQTCQGLLTCLAEIPSLIALNAGLTFRGAEGWLYAARLRLALGDIVLPTSAEREGSTLRLVANMLYKQAIRKEGVNAGEDEIRSEMAEAWATSVAKMDALGLTDPQSNPYTETANLRHGLAFAYGTPEEKEAKLEEIFPAWVRAKCKHGLLPLLAREPQSIWLETFNKMREKLQRVLGASKGSFLFQHLCNDSLVVNDLLIQCSEEVAVITGKPADTSEPSSCGATIEEIIAALCDPHRGPLVTQGVVREQEDEEVKLGTYTLGIGKEEARRATGDVQSERY